MKPKIGGRALRTRTLIDKDINVASFRPSTDEREFKDHKGQATRKQNLDPNYGQSASVFSEEADLTTILAQKFEEGVGQSLTPDSLETLQNELVERELNDYNCGHFLCSVQNRRRMPLRLWFLFELELMGDSETNFRNLCYHSQVYKKIDSEWQMKNLLQDQLVPAGSEFFPIEQLIIPTIELDHNSEVSSIGKLQVDIGDVLESKKIPPTFLSKRNLKSIFDQSPVRTSRILSTGSPTNSPDLQEVIAAQDEKRCTLLKKLSFLGGMDLPRLSDT